MKIGIIDDNKEARVFLRSFLQQTNRRDAIEEYESAKQVKISSLLDFDMLFLDIEMPDEGGLDIARKIRECQEKEGHSQWGSMPLIVFVTGYKEYMSEAFSVYAFDYLVKPVKEERLGQIYRRAQEILRKSASGKALLKIKRAGEFFAVPIDDILYVESSNRKNILHTAREKIEYYGVLSDLEKELPDYFFRIHKGYIVNMKYIEKYDRASITVRDGSKLLLSKYRYQAFVDAYMQFLL